ncbi:MAG: adenylyltransferase/cytidyltransferase family protein [Nitrosarchaeum sp.]|nr:adenylyltransferase/cytidyltransferase family protein [Nitrosarchaeum sp.]
MKGLYIGRFDPFHLGHLKAHDLFCKLVDEVKIGIGAQKETDLLSLEERVKGVCENTGVQPIELEDLDSNHPFYWDWGKYVLRKVEDVEIIATGNNYVKEDFIKNSIPVLWLPRYDNISGTIIRSKINDGDDSWKLLVPEKTKLLVLTSINYGRPK